MIILYATLHHQNHFCISVGRDGSHFNVLLIARAKSHDGIQRPQPLKREQSRSEIEPRSFCLHALPQGQTGSQSQQPKPFLLLSGVIWE